MTLKTNSSRLELAEAIGLILFIMVAMVTIAHHESHRQLANLGPEQSNLGQSKQKLNSSHQVQL